jgi:DNA replication and repair protein RecF
MIVQNLSARSFRNLRRLEIEPSPGLNLLVGRNGQGKTNFLEALYYLGLARSFRASRDGEMIAFEEEGFHLAADLRGDDGAAMKLEAAADRRGEKRFKRDGEAIRPLASVVGLLGVVFFGPEEMDLTSGSPGVRRRFLDMVACQVRADAAEHLRRYRRVVAQKTALLRAGAAGSGGSDLEAWNESLVETGARVVRLRREVVAGIDGPARDLYAELGVEEGDLDLIYRCSFSGGEDLEEDLWRELRRRGAEERRRGRSLVGAHRDDLLLSLGGREVRRFASQGQKRSVTIALKLAQARLIEERREERPVVLLDDVFSELDPARARALWSALGASNQMFLTVPRLAATPEPTGEAALFRVEEGRVGAGDPGGPDDPPEGAAAAPA